MKQISLIVEDDLTTSISVSEAPYGDLILEVGDRLVSESIVLTEAEIINLRNKLNQVLFDITKAKTSTSAKTSTGAV